LKRVAALALFALLFSRGSASAIEPSAITQSELIRRTQQLYDAEAIGDHTPWKLYLAEDFMVTDEKGRSMDRSALLDDLTPLPAGYGGSIKVVNAKSRFAPGVAILSYDLDELETVFGQNLHAHYHQTDTWLYRNKVWQIVASQILRYYEDPAVGDISKERLNDYVGTYKLSPENQMVITRKGNDLYAQRNSATPYKLLPESPDLFFREGAEGRKLFHRDASGQVDKLIDRRNNEDIVWKRTS
jgi:hypothetical protein